MNTPRAIARLRHNGIIGAMLAGTISYQEAMRLQEMKSNVELVMAASTHGINLLSTTERDFHEPNDRPYCPLADLLVAAP